MVLETSTSREPSSISPETSKNQEKTQPKKKKYLGIFRQFLTSFVISLTFLVMGSSVGWTSPALYNMRITGKPMNLSTTDASLMVSMYYIGNVVMPIPSGILSDIRGRRGTMLHLLILPLISWVMIFFAKIPAVLHVARFLSGMWTGIVVTVGPLYLAEIAEPGFRGAMSTMLMILANTGFLLVMFVGMRVSYWTAALFFGVTPILTFGALLYIPESPYWLIYKGQNGRAAKNLLWLRACEKETDVEEEINKLVILTQLKVQQRLALKTLFGNKGYKKAFTIVETVAVLHRLTGVSAMVGFVSVTLPDVSLGAMSFRDSQVVLIIAWTAAVLFTPFMIDRFGRIPLLGYSSIGCALSNMALSVWYYLYQSASKLEYTWIPFAMVLTYGCFANIGLNPIATTLQGEMFPSHLKGIASGITAMVVAGFSFLTCMLYLIIADHIGMYFNFLYFAVACVASAVFAWTYVIETKGKTLLEIQQELLGQPATTSP